MADAFVGNLRDGLGESITPELESNIDELHQSYIAFSQALIAELNASEPVLGLSPQERAVSPDILTISQAFTAMNMSDQINVLRNFQTGMSVTDSVS